MGSPRRRAMMKEDDASPKLRLAALLGGRRRGGRPHDPAPAVPARFAGLHLRDGVGVHFAAQLAANLPELVRRAGALRVAGGPALEVVGEGPGRRD
eukprot:4294272-Pyramimonas_sp.AAC.1